LNNKIIYLLSVSLIFALTFITQKAQASGKEQYSQIKIIPSQTILSPNSEITIATEIKLAPNWHVYWENPGDSGLPVSIEWDAPDGFKFSEIDWPTPHKISYDILVNYGYYDNVTLLQTLKIPDILPDGEQIVTASINMLICNEICIPEKHKISIDLNNLAKPNINNSEYIKNAKAKLPIEISGEFSYFEKDGALNISLALEDSSILDGAQIDKIDFFPLDWGIINNVAMPIVKIDNNNINISYERGDRELSEISELRGLLVIESVKGDNLGFTIAAQPQPADIIIKNIEKSPSTKTSKITWLTAIYLALFGGIILNLMPCVFPVLSMKALSLVKMGEKENKLARMHGIAYTLGVVLSFIAIGGLLLILKEAGTVIGWGFQLQNPIVVAVLAYLLFAIGLNLIGFFEFSFGLGSNIGNKLTQGKSLSSSFFTGTLATIVATPCTAPFMGAAMGFALTQPTIVSISIFAALGFGLALPYLILSYVPLFRKILPRPGAWMNTFKQALAFPMFASSIWLIWVLSQQSGSYGVLLVLLGMLAIAFCVWLSHLKSKGIAKNLTTILLVLCLFLPFFSLSYITTTRSNISDEKTQDFGEAFSQAKLDELLDGDAPIFVEMTAAWCITCKINHATAININSTKALFKQQNIEYLIGDWTNNDDAITRYLNIFERSGVPLYVYYGARDKQTGTRPEAVILPQVLTSAVIKKTVGNLL